MPRKKSIEAALRDYAIECSAFIRTCPDAFREAAAWIQTVQLPDGTRKDIARSELWTDQHQRARLGDESLILIAAWDAVVAHFLWRPTPYAFLDIRPETATRLAVLLALAFDGCFDPQSLLQSAGWPTGSPRAECIKTLRTGILGGLLTPPDNPVEIKLAAAAIKSLPGITADAMAAVRRPGLFPWQVGFAGRNEYEIALDCIWECTQLAAALGSVESTARVLLNLDRSQGSMLISQYCHVAACARLVRPLHQQSAGVVRRLYFGQVAPPICCGRHVTQTAESAVYLCALDVLDATPSLAAARQMRLFRGVDDPIYPVPGAPCPPAYREALEQFSNAEWQAVLAWWAKTLDLGVIMARGYLEREATELEAILRGARPDPLAVLKHGESATQKDNPVSPQPPRPLIVAVSGAHPSESEIRQARVRTAMIEAKGHVKTAIARLKSDPDYPTTIPPATFYADLKQLDAKDKGRWREAWNSSESGIPKKVGHSRRIGKRRGDSR